MVSREQILAGMAVTGAGVCLCSVLRLIPMLYTAYRACSAQLMAIRDREQHIADIEAACVPTP